MLCSLVSLGLQHLLGRACAGGSLLGPWYRRKYPQLWHFLSVYNPHRRDFAVWVLFQSDVLLLCLLERTASWSSGPGLMQIMEIETAPEAGFVFV